MRKDAGVDSDAQVNADEVKARGYKLDFKNPHTRAEVYVGAFKREHKDIEALFDLCQRIDMDVDTGRVAGLYANQFSKTFQGISLED